MASQAGWYPDPGGQPGMYRYWTGTAWTEAITPYPQSTPAPQVPTGAPPAGLGEFAAVIGPGGTAFLGDAVAQDQQVGGHGWKGRQSKSIRASRPRPPAPGCRATASPSTV